MPRGRRPNLIPTVEWAVMIPADLALKVELRLMNPATGAATYGARSKLLQALLHEWLQGQQAPVDTLGQSG